MNYYNPYFYTMPNVPKVGLFRRIFGDISFSNIINGTERIVSLANQTIPLVKQVKPIIGNAKTIFKVMNEFKKSDTNIKEKTNYNGPTFYA